MACIKKYDYQLFQCTATETKLFHLDDILESSETLAIGLEKKQDYQLFQSPETDGLAPSKGWARFQTEFLRQEFPFFPKKEEK